MAVNLTPVSADKLAIIDGIELNVAEAGIKKANRKDVLVIRIDKGNTVAGVFTRYRSARNTWMLAYRSAHWW